MAKPRKTAKPSGWTVAEFKEEIDERSKACGFIAEVEYPDDFIAIYTAFRDQAYSPQSVLYPACGFDGSPARAFSNVTFVDPENGNEGCIEQLQKAGLHAIKQDIRLYRPKEEHDLLILLNAAIEVRWASQHLKPGGFVIANDYLGNATQAHSMPEELALWGTIDIAESDAGKTGYKANVSRNLEGLFQRVRNSEELRRVRPEHYKFLESVFRMYELNRVPGYGKDRSFDEMLKTYNSQMLEDMPFKRAAEMYIFVKK